MSAPPGRATPTCASVAADRLGVLARRSTRSPRPAIDSESSPGDRLGVLARPSTPPIDSESSPAHRLGVLARLTTAYWPATGSAGTLRACASPPRAGRSPPCWPSGSRSSAWTRCGCTPARCTAEPRHAWHTTGRCAEPSPSSRGTTTIRNGRHRSRRTTTATAACVSVTVSLVVRRRFLRWRRRCPRRTSLVRRPHRRSSGASIAPHGWRICCHMRMHRRRR